LVKRLDSLHLRIGHRLQTILLAVLGCLSLQLILNHSPCLYVEVVLVDIHVGENNKVIWNRALNSGMLNFLVKLFTLGGVQSKFVMISLLVA
jgi:hypothetical protein